MATSTTSQLVPHATSIPLAISAEGYQNRNRNSWWTQNVAMLGGCVVSPRTPSVGMKGKSNRCRYNGRRGERFEIDFPFLTQWFTEILQIQNVRFVL